MGSPHRVYLFNRKIPNFSRLYNYKQAVEMLNRRSKAGVSASGRPSSGPSSTSQPSGPSNTAYTPLKRRESANLYPAPSSANKARFPLPSPGLGTYSSPQTNNDPILSSPIHINTSQGYGYVGAAGASPYNAGAGRTYDISREKGGMGMEGDKRGMKEIVLAGIRRSAEQASRGFWDAGRLDRSWNLAWK